MGVNAVLFGIIGILGMRVGNPLVAAIWLVCSALWLTSYLWSRFRPYLQLSADTLTIYPGLMRSARTISREKLRSFRQADKNDVHLHLATGERVTISLINLDSRDREALLADLEAFLGKL